LGVDSIQYKIPISGFARSHILFLGIKRWSWNLARKGLSIPLEEDMLLAKKTLLKIISIILHKNIKLKKVNQIESQGLIKRNIKRLKFDLVNMINEGMPFS
jgi:hypothetical protein